jgi:membrane AbrB-like protein
MSATLLLILVCGVLGALVARGLRLPVWPMTGALGGVAVLQLTGLDIERVPDWLGVTAQVIVGTVVGSRINGHIVQDFFSTFGPSATAVLVMLLAGLGLGAGLAASGLLSHGEALLGMMPGGVGEMVAASAAVGADSSVVAGMHLVRLLIVLSALPLIVRLYRRHQAE